jgi:hypothetical protein
MKTRLTRTSAIGQLSCSSALRSVAVLFVFAVASLTISNGEAKAANISRVSTFECGVGAVDVYFPFLYTTSGWETVYFSPDLWKYNAVTGYQPYDTSKPWYSAAVGPNGIGLVNGYKWFDWPNGVPYSSVRFRNLPSGSYKVAGYFYQGSSHWSTLYGTTNSTTCKVS